MKIFNTLTRTKEEFRPINDNVVNMYVCGPTVYDLFHIGNARTFIFFDCVRRFLEHKGYCVNFIQNFTDIDDKIINKAISESNDISVITERYIDEFYIDSDNLNIKRATRNPKATDNISVMIDLIEKLIDNGYAYEVDGDVYFSVRSFQDYGKLFGQDIDTLKSGSRIEVNKKKNDALDFILWKKSKKDEPSYISPWGMGRPGWHTECCAMIDKYFDCNTIDIHGGGVDLVFPHHENEIAQVECFGNRKLANYWMHCSFLNIDQQKMSKSLGNFLTARDACKMYSGNVIRFALLSAHYRNNISFSNEILFSSKKSLSRIEKTYFNLLELKDKVDKNEDLYCREEVHNYYKKFILKMEDDFNTADAISEIFGFIKYINKNLDDFNYQEINSCIKFIEDFLFIFGLEYNKKNSEQQLILDNSVKEMVIQRIEYKKIKEFNKSDLIRNQLSDIGFILEDIKGGTRIINKYTNELIDTILS